MTRKLRHSMQKFVETKENESLPGGERHVDGLCCLVTRKELLMYVIC